MGGTKTLVETSTSVQRKGDVVTVTTVEKTTVTEEGKDPKVTTTEKVEKYEGKDGMEKLPAEIKKQLEESKEVKGPINKTAAKSDFEKDLLEYTNKKREAHGAHPLKITKEASKYALERATEMAKKDEMLPRDSREYGENVRCMWSNDPNHIVKADEIFDSFYEGHTKYDYDAEPADRSPALSFTQAVWKGSKHFGAAAVKSASNKIFVVAAYEPAGNIIGQFRANVSAQKSGVGAFLKSLIPKKKSDSESDSDDESSADDFNKKSVRVHNELRKKHGVPPLAYSATLAKYAQEWAEHLAKHKKFEHRTGHSYGENLYTCRSSSGAKPSAEDACNSWYSEIRDYTFGQEPRSHKTGHFTQVIWKSSKEVGVGIAKDGLGWIVVANYSPPGNFIGQYVANVPKPT